MNISSNFQSIRKNVPQHIDIIAVSKNQTYKKIQSVYELGHKIFGENRIKELVGKYNHLPKDIEWHMIGHLQTNKVKKIASFVSLIHSLDSLKLMEEINKRAQQNDRTINCLLQIHIGKEESKFGFSINNIENIIEESMQYQNIKITGLMGMATFTDKQEQIQSEFRSLKKSFEKIKGINENFSVLSMGMSGDYKIAIQEGSTMVRIGSSIFGKRN